MAKKKRKSMKDKVRNDSRRSASGGNYLTLPQGVNYFTAEPGGRCKIDILLYTITDTKHPDRLEVGDDWYKRPYRIHRDVGAEKDIEICPRSIKKPCPICEHRESLLTAKDADEEITKALKAKDRVLYNVRPLSGPDKGKILVWDCSYYLFQKQLDAELNDPENEEFLTFADLEGGHSLRIRFASETFGERGKPFAKTERIDFDSRDDLDESILEDTINLDKVLNVKTYKELQNKFFEMDDEDTDDEMSKASEEQNMHESETKSERQKKTKEPKEETKTITLPSENAIKKMSRKKLAGVIKEFKLDTLDAEDYDDTDELRDAVIIELHGGNTTSKSEKEEETPSKMAKENTSNPTCPYGHNWGEADGHEECDDCEKWDDCIAAT